MGSRHAGRRRRRRWAILVGTLPLILAACRPEVRRFPLAPPLWEDPDRNHVPKKPRVRFVGKLADGADKLVFWRLSRPLWVPLPGEAKNVNALDEVPSSAWFQNRIGWRPLSPARVARGPCPARALDPALGPWVVTKSKEEGATPGFFIRTPQGRFLLKFDGAQGRGRTSADVVGSRLWWAAGYHVPCNRIVIFPEDVLQIGAGATTVDALGRKRPMTAAHVRKVLGQAFRPAPNRVRAMASLLLSGEPLGPFAFEGTRADDPNDVVPHEDRRELRAMRLLAAWINHVDSRQQNTLDMWVERGGRRFVQHHLLDWGDALGEPWPVDALTRRMGHAYGIDPWQILGDLVSLGGISRPWEWARIAPAARELGYFRVAGFVASRWKPAYPNPAFQRMTTRDALWMVRIIARLTDAHLRAIAAEARLGDSRLEAHLAGVLMGRRDRILREYLTRHAPLARIRLAPRPREEPGQGICFEHLGVALGVVDPRRVQYRIRLLGGARLQAQLGWALRRPGPGRSGRLCVPVPLSGRRPAALAPPGAPDDHPLRYGVLEIRILQRAEQAPSSIVEVHLYDLGALRGFRLVGIRRLDPDRLPKPSRGAFKLP